MRTCTECGKEYANEDPAKYCYGTYQSPDGKTPALGRGILPCCGLIGQAPIARTFNCLLCLDSGQVPLAAGETRRCPRGCEQRP